MSKKGMLIHGYKSALKSQTKFGESKHKAKIHAKEESCQKSKPYEPIHGIYSTSTLQNYDGVCNRFVQWIMENHRNEVKNYSDCKKFASEWLQIKEADGLSAWSLNLYDTPDVTIEDTVYEIAGKYFDDLEEDVQQEILRFKFNVQAFEDVTDETIEEIFFRLNNSTPLTKPQKAKPLMGVNNSIFINEILAGRFFTEKCNFTRRQLTQSADLCTLLQGMMLLDNKYRGYDFPNISDDEAMAYSKWINGNYPDDCRCRVKKIVAFLDNLFYIKEKNLRKINIPILFLMADKALKLSISGTSFRRWFNNFFDYHKDEYNQYCSSGSVKKEKTIGRIGVMGKYFDAYFRTATEAARQEETTELSEHGAEQQNSEEPTENAEISELEISEIDEQEPEVAADESVGNTYSDTESAFASEVADNYVSNH